MSTSDDRKKRDVNYGGSPFGAAAPYISAAAFASVILFIFFLDQVAHAMSLDSKDIEAITLWTAFAGAFAGLTGTWENDQKTKSLGRTFCILNFVIFLAYGALFLLFAYGGK